MKFLYFWVQWPRALKRVWAVTLVLGLLGASTLLYGSIVDNTQEIPEQGGAYYEAVLSRVQNVNPYYCYLSSIDKDICSLVFTGLTKYDPVSKQISGDIAYKWDVNEDGTQYIFHLRNDVYWHDGVPLTAEDVVFSYRDVLQSPDYLGTYQMAFYNVTIEAIDDKTVQFTLQEPQSFFLYTVTMDIIPKHILGEVPVIALEQHTFSKSPVGTGPFELVSVNTDKDVDIVTLSAYKDYYGENPNIDSIIIYGFNNATDLLNKQHIFDGINDVQNPSFINDNFDVYPIQLPRVTGVFFNLNNSILSDYPVREALRYAINKDAVLADMENISVIHTALPYVDSNITHVYDIEKAKETLYDAGWKIYSEEYDDGIRRNENDEPLTVILATTKSEANMNVAENIKNAWLEAGVQTEIVSLEIGDLQESLIKPRKYDILLISTELQPNVDLYPYFHSSQLIWPGLNIAQYKNVESDLLLDKIRATYDYNEQLILTNQLLDKLNAHIPAIYLYAPVANYYVQSDIMNVKIPLQVGHLSDRFFLFNEWAKKTRKIWK